MRWRSSCVRSSVRPSGEICRYISRRSGARSIRNFPLASTSDGTCGVAGAVGVWVVVSTRALCCSRGSGLGSRLDLRTRVDSADWARPAFAVVVCGEMAGADDAPDEDDPLRPSRLPALPRRLCSSTLFRSMAASPSDRAIESLSVAWLVSATPAAGAAIAAWAAVSADAVSTAASNSAMSIRCSTRSPSCAVTSSMRWPSSPASRSASRSAASRSDATLVA